MLVALQPIKRPLLLCPATERHRLLELITLLRETDVETGRGGGALYGKAVRVMEHAHRRLGIVRIGIGILNLEWSRVHHHGAEREELAKRCSDFSSGIPVHERLIFNIRDGNDRALQTTILTDFYRLEKPLVPIHQTLVRVLGTELGVGELRKEELLLLRLPRIRH